MELKKLSPERAQRSQAGVSTPAKDGRDGSPERATERSATPLRHQAVRGNR